MTENLQLGVAKDDKKMPQKTKSNRKRILPKLITIKTVTMFALANAIGA